MNVLDADQVVASIAATIGEPARARMLYSLVDGRARTATELAMVGEVTPSTASVHLRRLAVQRLVKVVAQGKHRYYTLAGTDVNAALEALNVLAGAGPPFAPTTPPPLRDARTCYDHIAGTLGVAWFDRLVALGWLSRSASDACGLTAAGVAGLAAVGIDVNATRALRRRFAFACLDWSERRPHLGGALGAALLQLALRRRWATQELDSRALVVTAAGRRALKTQFDLVL